MKYFSYITYTLLLLFAFGCAGTDQPPHYSDLEDDFWMNLEEREKVVEMVTSGELENRDLLPSGLEDLSKKSEIFVSYQDGIKSEGQDQLSILFFTYLGFSDSFSGFVYRENDLEPTNTTFDCGLLMEVKRIKENWYWMACT